LPCAEENAQHRLCRAYFAQAHGKGLPAHFYPVKNFAVRFGKRQRTTQFFAVCNTWRTAKKRCWRPSAGRRHHTLSAVRRWARTGTVVLFAVRHVARRTAKNGQAAWLTPPFAVRHVARRTAKIYLCRAFHMPSFR
jgi:hypothetical protein